VEPQEYARTAEAEEHHFWFRELRRVWTRLLREAGSMGRGSVRALDAGCGTGANLRLLERGRAAVGIDLSPLAIRIARSKVTSPLSRATILQLPFRAESFGIVLCTDVIYHKDVRDDVAALKEIRRVLQPGGIVLINVPAFEALRSAHDRAVHTARRYNRTMLRERICAAGLEPVRIIYWNALLLGPAVLLRLLRKRGGNRSDIVKLPEPLNALMTAVAILDATAALRGLFPAGLSLAAIARR